MRLVEKGIPGVPRIIGPHTHRLLDYLTTGAFLFVGALFWKNHKRASIGAIVNGAFVLGATLLTDYDGDGRRPLSFDTHGDLDTIQAGMAAAVPRVLGFADEGKAWFFRAQAMNEMAVIAMTDYESTTRRHRAIRDVAA
jgi:hypothetical protein